MDKKKDILRTVTRYAQAGEWVKVIKEYQKLLKMDSNDITLYNSIGDALAKLNEHRAAYEHYKKVLDDYQRKGNNAKISFLYKKIAKLNPLKFDLEGKDLHEKISTIVQAIIFYDKEDYTRALPALKEAAKVEPKNVDVLSKLGEVAEELTHIGDSSEAYTKAMRLYIDNNKPAEAIDLAKKILNIDKANVEATAMIAEDLINRGEKDKAEEMYREVFITLAEKNSVREGIDISKRAMEHNITYGKQFYAYFLFKADRTEEAKTLLERGNDLTPEEKVLLGKIYYKTEEYSKAKDILLSMDPVIVNENVEILEHIADAYLKMREHAKAGDYYLKAVKLLREKDMMDAAIGMAHKVLNVNTENTQLYEILVDIYTRKGMKDQLIETYEKLAGLYDKEGRTEDSLNVKQILSKLKMI